MCKRAGSQRELHETWLTSLRRWTGLGDALKRATRYTSIESSFPRDTIICTRCQWGCALGRKKGKERGGETRSLSLLNNFLSQATRNSAPPSHPTRHLIRLTDPGPIHGPHNLPLPLCSYFCDLLAGFRINPIPIRSLSSSFRCGPLPRRNGRYGEPPRDRGERAP